MSKSKGNVVAPEPIIERYGSDVLRCFLMFSGDYSQGGEWSDAGIAGIERFIARVWRLGLAIAQGQPSQDTDIPADLDRKLHQTIKAVSSDLQEFHFNTALARLMELTNAIYAWVCSELKNVKRSPAAVSMLENLVRLMAPFAPHMAEEVWAAFGHHSTVFDEPWPKWDEEKAREDSVTIAVQINGKLRETMTVARDLPQEEAARLALELEKIRAHVSGMQVVKTIVVPNRIVNIVVK